MTEKSYAYSSVEDFHRVFGHPINEPITKEVANFRLRLIDEEFIETIAELNDLEEDQVDKAALTLELADMLYVIYGLAVAFGLPLDDGFRAKHESNMSKLGADGKPIYREDGKVLKGPNFKPANIDHLFPEVSDAV